MRFDRSRFPCCEATVIARLLRWAAKILLVLILLVVAVLAGFRIAAAFRETATREAFKYWTYARPIAFAAASLTSDGYTPRMS